MDNYYNHIKLNGWSKDGGALQAAFTAMKAEWELNSAKENYYSDYRTLENCFTSFLQYVQHFSQDELMLKVINTEEPFKILMKLNSDEEYAMFKDLKEFHFTGKIDMEIELNGQLWINEHKTTGQPIDTQVSRLNRSAQVMGYHYAKSRMLKDGITPAGVLMTVHHLSCRKSTAKGNEVRRLTLEGFRRYSVKTILISGELRSCQLHWIYKRKRNEMYGLCATMLVLIMERALS
jgi:hypothetical protein